MLKYLKRKLVIFNHQGLVYRGSTNSKYLVDKGASLIPYFQAEIDLRKERINYIKSKLESVDNLLEGV
jgi:hypothetical protein